MPLLQDVLLGLYIGVLTGVFAAIIVYILTFSFAYLAGTQLSVNYALMIGLGIAGVAGGPRLLMRNPDILRSATSLVMLISILLITLYSHQKAQDLGKALPPKKVIVNRLRKKTIALNAVKQIGPFGQVTVRPAGVVGDMEGYPPLPDAIRTGIQMDSWTFPADLPISELETRLKKKLERKYHLEDAIVSIDSEGRATVSAAPSIGGFSRRIPDGKQVVTVETLLPDGLAGGDDVRMTLDETTVTGHVISVRPDTEPSGAGEQSDTMTDAQMQENTVPSPGALETASSGTGRVAVAIDPGSVSNVLEEDLQKLYARSKGRIKAFEFVSLLRRYDLRFRKVTLGADGESLDRTLGELDFRDAYGVVVLALKRANTWRFAPDQTVRLQPNDELFVTGPKPGLDSLQAVIA